MLGREHAIGHPALTDRSTGLANRLHFELVYSYLFEAGDRGVSLSVMLISIPNAAEVEGDVEQLRTIGERIQDTTRMADLAAHLGHGRFIVLLLGANLQGARIAADRLEGALRDVGVSDVSIGLTMYQNEMKQSSELLENADKALRAAESSGGGVEIV